MDDPFAEIDGRREMEPSVREEIDRLAQAIIDSVPADDWRAILRANPTAASEVWEQVREFLTLARGESSEHEGKRPDLQADPGSRPRPQVHQPRDSHHRAAVGGPVPEISFEPSDFKRAREEALKKWADDPFTELGSEPSDLDRARDSAVQLIALAVGEVLRSSRRLRNQISGCWHLLWQPLDAERKLAPYPSDPFQLRRWRALIHDVRQHVRRALPPSRKGGDAWPPNGHVIWQEGLGMLRRDDLTEATALLGDMPSAEFAKLVKHA
jgi:hypothetical protein